MSYTIRSISVGDTVEVMGGAPDLATASRGYVEPNRFEVFAICRGRAWLAPVGLRSVEPGDARFSVELSALNRLDDWNTGRKSTGE